MDNKDNSQGIEPFTPENDPVSRLLGSLDRVEAPADFQIRVRARIASGRPTTVPGSWLPASLRLAVPLVLLLTVGGYFALNSFYSPGPAYVPPIAVSQQQTVQPAGQPEIAAVPIPVRPEPANEMIVAENSPAEPAESGIVFSARPAVRRNSGRRPPFSQPVSGGSVDVEPSGGGSLDMGSGITREIYPKGLDPNGKVLVKRSDVERSAPLTVKEVLSPFGLDAVYTGSAWSVSSVKQNSKAERAGLRPGDVIESLNGEPVSGTTVYAGKFIGKSMRVVRDGKPISIDLTR